MERTLIKDFKNYVGQTVTMAGWMYNKRGSGKIYFLQLRDGTGMTQGIAEAAFADGEVIGGSQREDDAA